MGGMERFICQADDLMLRETMIRQLISDSLSLRIRLELKSPPAIADNWQLDGTVVRVLTFLLQHLIFMPYGKIHAEDVG